MRKLVRQQQEAEAANRLADEPSPTRGGLAVDTVPSAMPSHQRPSPSMRLAAVKFWCEPGVGLGRRSGDTVPI